MMKNEYKNELRIIDRMCPYIISICGSAEGKCGEYGGHRQKGYCSIDFKTGGDDKVSADLGTTTVDVKLYKVADISEVGDYTASGDFAQLDVSALDASDSTSADEWLKRATEAVGMVTDSTKPTAEVFADRW